MSKPQKLCLTALLLLGAAQTGFCCGGPERPELRGCGGDAPVQQAPASAPQEADKSSLVPEEGAAGEKDASDLHQ